MVFFFFPSDQVNVGFQNFVQGFNAKKNIRFRVRKKIVVNYFGGLKKKLGVLKMFTHPLQDMSATKFPLFMGA
jgi:hypothetical protein